MLINEGSPSSWPGAHADGEHGTDDAALIAASVHDPELFALVYDRHAAVLYRFAGRRLGPELAEDAVSDTMLAALTIRHRYNPERPDARPWLLGILTREISHHRRTERNRYQTLSRTPHDREAQDSPADRVAAQVTAASVRGPLAGALATLATRDRDVLLLVAWADLSYAEVADALAVPIGTVRSRLNRARRQIRKALPDLHLSLADETTADKDMS